MSEMHSEGPEERAPESAHGAQPEPETSAARAVPTEVAGASGERPRTEEPRRLYRSRTNRMIGGVAGGIGEYLGVDPTIIRILWVIFAFTGVGFIAYIAALLVIPERPIGEEVPGVATSAEPAGATQAQGPSQPSPQPAPPAPGEAALIIGIALIALGAWFLLSNLNIIPFQFFAFWRFIGRAFWPSLLILIGILVIIASSRGRSLGTGATGRPLYRSRMNRRISGVAGGLGEYLGVDPTLIRLAWVVVTIINPPVGLIGYIVAAIVIPEEPR